MESSVAAEAVHNSTDQIRFEATYQVYRVTESPERHYPSPSWHKKIPHSRITALNQGLFVLGGGLIPPKEIIYAIR